MSETITPAVGTFASVLDALHAQQQTLPEHQRGLDRELSALRAQIEANPALENDPRFWTQVSWLVQDWQAHSGTGQLPQISPFVIAGLNAMSAQPPGLESQDLRALLAKTPALQDRALVNDIRAQAIAFSQQSAEEQGSVAAIKTSAILDYRVSLAAPKPDLQPQPAIVPAGAADQNAPRAATAEAIQTSDQTPTKAAAPTPQAQNAPQEPDNRASPAQQPAGQAINVPPIAQKTATAGPVPGPSAASADPAMDRIIRDKERSQAKQAERQAAGPADGQTTQDENQPGRQAAQTTSPGRDGTGQRGNTPASPPAASPNVEQNAVGDAAAGLVSGILGAAASVATGTVEGLRRGLSDQVTKHQQHNDRRQITERIAVLTTAATQVEDDLRTLKRQGGDFFSTFDAAVARSGGNAGQVIAGMSPGGDHEALHGKLRSSISQDPEFLKAWKQINASAAKLGQQVEYLREDAERRQMSNDPAVIEAEGTAAKTGWKLKNLPGYNPGKNLLEEASKFVDALVERFRHFLEKVFGQSQTRDNSRSPGM